MNTQKIEKIRSKYIPKQISKFEELKALDKKVKRPAEVFAYLFGSISSLILGAGMCLTMGVIGTTLAVAVPLGVIIGMVGILLMLVTHPFYKAILNARKKKYCEKILELSDRLLNNKI